MDRGKLAELAGNVVAGGTPPTAEDVANVLTEQELADALVARRAALATNVGSNAVRVSVRSQVESMIPAAYAAYVHNAATINSGRKRSDNVTTTTERRFRDGAMDALDAPTLAYMEAVKEQAGGQTLWVPKSAPNTELSVAEQINLAEANGGLIRKPLYGWNGRADFLNRFPTSLLSGNDPNSDQLVVHQFAPSTLTPQLYGTVRHQRNVYEQLRAENPGVDIHAPALAHSIGGWAIHADTGLALPAYFDTTYDRSVEVAPQPLYGYDDLCVPCSDVSGAFSDVDRSWADGDSVGRAWVGSNSNLAA